MKSSPGLKNITDPPVLKPFWGLPVKVWVPCIWIGITIFLLWFCLPVLFSPQSTLTVTSTPGGTPVFWREEFIGHTPLKMKITHNRIGKGSLVLERLGFARVEEKLNLSSWCFPFSFLGDMEVFLELPCQLSNEDLVNQALKELSYWTSLGEHNLSRPAPSLFSDFVSDFYENPELSHSFLKQGFSLINSVSTWQDFWKAYEVLFGFKAEDPWIRWNDLKSRFDLDPFFLGAFYNKLSHDEQMKIKSNKSFIETVKNTEFSVNIHFEKMSSPIPPLPKSLTSSFPFLLIQESCKIFMADNLISPDLTSPTIETLKVYTPPFYLSCNPVSKDKIEEFLRSNSSWLKKYQEELIEEGLADEDYLKSSKWDSMTANHPAVFVPFYLAKAYADWINKTVLKGTGLVAKLPSTFQWQSIPDNFQTPVANQELGLWFWMRDPHLDKVDWHRTTKNPFGVSEDFPTFEGEIRSLPNSLLDLDLQTTASLPRHWSAPHLSFYLVIEKETAL